MRQQIERLVVATWIVFMLAVGLVLIRLATWQFDDGPVDQLLAEPFAQPAIVQAGDDLVTYWSYEKLRDDCDSTLEASVTDGNAWTMLARAPGSNSPRGRLMDQEFRVTLPRHLRPGTYEFVVTGWYDCNPLVTIKKIYPRVEFQVAE